MSTCPAVDVVGVHKRYPLTAHTAHASSPSGASPATGNVVAALRGVDLSIASGSFIAIMGASGSGKSTLLHLMAGLDQPDEGLVSVAGQDLSQGDDRSLTAFRRQHIGMVFQAFNLVPVLSASDNVALPLLLDGVSRREAQQRAAAGLALLGLADRASHFPDQLSGGEQQRVAIARGLICDPAVILADEPTGNLDSVGTAEIGKVFQRLHQEESRTIVVITHNTALAVYAEEVILLADGEIRGRLQGEMVQDVQALSEQYHYLTQQALSSPVGGAT